MSKEGQPRADIERDITDKIWAGKIATLHLPARDMHAFYALAVGEEFKDFASRDIHMHPSAFNRSLGYLRETFEVESTEQAFGMLVARGFPLPEEFMPLYQNPQFSQTHLDAIKLWVEGESLDSMNNNSEKVGRPYGQRLYRARQRVNASSNIQLVAVAVREEFLQSQQQEDGSFTFAVDTNPKKLISERQKQFLVMRFHGMTNMEIASKIGRFHTTISYILSRANHSVGVHTITELILHCVKTGQIDIDTLVANFDISKVEGLTKVQRDILEKALADETYDSYEIGNQLGYTEETITQYRSRTIQTLGVKNYLQAMVLYKAAVDKGIIPPFEENQNGHGTLPQSAVIFSPDQQ